MFLTWMGYSTTRCNQFRTEPNYHFWRERPYHRELRLH